MIKRGKKSAAELSVIVDVSRRLPPPPPAELSDAQAAVWRDTAANLPGDWLDACGPLLVEYCRHICRSRLIERLVRDFEAEWIKAGGGLERLDRLLAMAERESRAALACARSLRLTPQSRIEPRTAGSRIAINPIGRRPWD
jgi:hypothetical protein